MLKIIPANKSRKVNNLVFVLYGMPGLGKTSAAFTCKKPLLLDFDNGYLRAAKKGDATPPILNWADIVNLSVDDLSNYDTIIIDTVGRSLEVLSDSLIKQNPKYGKADGSLSLPGFGALSVSFKTFINKLRGFGKDIVLLAHAKEDKDGETITYRIDAQGSAKQEVYKVCDMMGYFYMINNSTHLSFNPSDSYIGKNCAGIKTLKIPDMSINDHYLADIIQQTKDALNSMSEDQIKAQQLYDDSIAMINDAKDLETINNLIELCSKNPGLKNYLHEKAKNLGFTPNSKNKCYEFNAA